MLSLRSLASLALERLPVYAHLRLSHTCVQACGDLDQAAPHLKVAYGILVKQLVRRRAVIDVLKVL